MSIQVEKNIHLEEALVGVRDVAIIRQLSKNTTSLSVEGVLERWLFPWDLKKICEYEKKMPATNVLANLFVTIYNTEARRKGECIVLPTSKLATKVLTTLEKEGYIGKFERIEDNRGGKFKINLLAKITKCGAITPRFKVKKTEYSEWEQQYLPSYTRGMLLVTTNQGVMSHHDAANKGIGGFLIGYVY
jgi:small subunit ribosomal protein S8